MIQQKYTSNAFPSNPSPEKNTYKLTEQRQKILKKSGKTYVCSFSNNAQIASTTNLTIAGGVR